ncbi:MAG TPA: RloB family protein [Longimicrobium sp.]|nr:RloB family protein [Longimicrobium sp.]
MAARRRRNDDRALARRAPTRTPLPLLLVVCEGRVTEPQYLRGFARAQGANTVRLVVEAPGGDPRALVERAIELRDEAAARAVREGDENLAYDEVWCVFDVDDHARLRAARELAERTEIGLAVSNPCFELWLILHFREHGAHLTSRRAAQLLEQHIPGYHKHVRFDDLSIGYADAVERAKTLERRHLKAGTDGANPSTGAHRLTERIRMLGKANRLKS